MSDQRVTIQLESVQQAAPKLTEVWQWIKTMLKAGHRVVLTARKETRSLAQNALMWSCLTDLSEQVKWDGTRRLSPEGWKDYLTAHLNGQDLVPNMDGTGFVAIGRGSSTSDMTIAEMTAVIDLAHAFGDGRGVKWKRTSLGRDCPDEVAPPVRQRQTESEPA
jgi:hypothetical protein